ncbi:Ubiquitin conjugation factor E4 A [Armadillidium nasatum]|uniref:Ubiquitin conjugation factor E4 A n=1 Tax=Armadillidium nasatum TaxID=96803 RepID=A0A5N5TP19_9CRUS|nr:Ubiquitin conjugation factor E4 A [Armadillidium nasatum]
MSKSLKENPFCALFSSVEDAERFTSSIQSTKKDTSDVNCLTPQSQIEPSVIEKILLVSTRNHVQDFTYVLMNDSPSLTPETIDVVLFERLLLKDVENCIQNTRSKPNFNDRKLEAVGRKEVLIYLFEVYDRCWQYKETKDEVIDYIQSLVITNLITAFEQPEVFFDQNLNRQFRDLVFNNISTSQSLPEMLNKFLVKCNEHGEAIYLTVFKEISEEIKLKLSSSSLMNIDWTLLDIMDFYSSSPQIAPLLLECQSRLPGHQFQLSCLGGILSISCLPKDSHTQSEFFDQPSSQAPQYHKMTENSIGIAQKALNSRTYSIFMTLLKVSPEIKDKFLKWIENCLEANSGRAGIWHIQSEEIRNLAYVSDSFMVNLGAVMLKLASPFSSVPDDVKNLKILKVDPFYCSSYVAKHQNEIKGVYSGNLSKQTALVPTKEEENSESNSKNIPEFFSFTTTCFYLTHRALHLGVQVAFNMNIRKLRVKALLLPEMMRKYMEKKTSVFLAYRAAGFEPSLVDDVLQFLAATSLWLTQIALTPDDERLSPELKKISLIDLSDEKHSKSLLRFVPEFIVENLVEGIIAIKRYMAEAFTLSGEPYIKHFMSFIISFMGSPQWMNNPHLRAHLAECLETLMPSGKDNAGLVSGVRERLFVEHPLSPHLVTAIIHVFVSIEMTGQSVAFEEKFNYRRPMYEIMKFFWSIPEHRKQFIELANYALSNMESSKPPLFLRFVNLLINDAIFLLDEGLSYMSQIREYQTAKDSGEWNQLSAEQRTEREQNLRQMGYLARFHNMLGSRTIQTLLRLTKDIPGMFTHPTLIDRMSAMLNHFLAHLVGPKQRNLKVKDMEKYEFKPAEIVSDICTIYIHLSKEPEFCNAVCADDRSYSPELFNQACNVLMRIGRYSLKEDLEKFSVKVSEACAKRTEDGDLAALAPEEFIDPIMQQIMIDPVLLPSSRIIVDRQTIARHLLSDQTDPFNRQPLNMEEIISDEDLKTRIHDWLKERKQSSN